MRRLFRDISKSLAEVPTPETRQPAPTPTSANGRRRFSDIEFRAAAYGDHYVAPGLEPKFVPAEFSDSQYHKWAAKYFNAELWRALPHQEVNDLLQESCIKYMRCVELYVYGKCTCRGPKHLMNIFKTACSNMLTDESRKKMRCPEKYTYHVLDTTMDHGRGRRSLDSDTLLDNSFATAIEASTLKFEINYKE